VVVLRFSISSVLAAVAVTATVAHANAQQPDITLNPFVTFLPAGQGPMTGLALMMTGGPFSLRAGGHISLRDGTVLPGGSSASMRPWGADADAISYLETYRYGSHAIATPYVFAGVSTAAVDSASVRITQDGWSYGGGVAVPLFSAIGVFGELRWRMSKYVWPNARSAPPSTSEFRIGGTFHIGSGGESGHAVPVVTGSDGTASFDGSGSASAGALRLLSAADQLIGTPYRRGGTSPSSGFDASGFVRFVFSRLGVMLPRASRDQARVGERVSPDLHIIAPGDLVMFQDDGGINHVAIYVGGGRIIHSSETGGGVRYDDLATDRGRWFLDHMVAARRVQPDLRGLLLDLARGYSNQLSNDEDGPDHAPRARKR
jgi:cell wall-associated NlpC family hydrolase